MRGFGGGGVVVTCECACAHTLGVPLAGSCALEKPGLWQFLVCTAPPTYMTWGESQCPRP